jgi:HAMP domain-containing protein
MDLSAVAGLSRLAVAAGVVVGIAGVVVLARLLARRSSRTERTLVTLNSRE